MEKDKKKEQKISLDVKTYPDGKILLDFYSDFERFKSEQCLPAYILTAENLLSILQNKINYNLLEEL